MNTVSRFKQIAGWTVLCLLIIFSNIKPVQAQTTKGLMKDSLALVAFYNSTKSSRYWSGYKKWEGKPISRWAGVKLDKRGGELRVTSITLKGTIFTKIEGEIPSSIGNLEYLEYLMLTYHNFSGSLPNEIGNLVNLETLIIENSNMEGKVPSTIKNLTNLKTLSFYQNKMTGNPLDDISYLKSLEYLFLNNNEFSGAIPASIGNLTKLETLNIGHNNFTGEPGVALKDCKKLSRLDVSDNPKMKTRSILENLEDFPNMNNMDLDNTIINGTMPEVTKENKNLVYLDLDSTGVKGKIPESIIKLTGLNEFYIANNDVTELPVLPGLRELGADNNELEFDDIERNMTIPSMHYNPQKEVYNALEVSAREGSKVTFHAKIGGKENIYQWRRDLRRVDTTNNASFTVSNFSSGDAGNYTCSIRNSIATRTTIKRKPVDVSMLPRIEIGNEFPITIDGDLNIPGASYEWSNGSKRTKTTFTSGDTLRLKVTIGNDVTIEEEWIIELPWDEAPPKPDKIITFENVLFEQGKTEIISGTEELDKLAKMLNAYPDVYIMVMGHTDNQGDPRKNQILSENRTKVIRKYLVDKGVKIYRIETKGYGDSMPKYSNLKESTRKLNRRVEFMVIDKNK